MLKYIFVLRFNFVCADICGSWRTRWLVVKDNFVAYTQPSTGRVKCVILFDSAFEVSSGIFPTNVLLISNLSRCVKYIYYNINNLYILLIVFIFILSSKLVSLGSVSNSLQSLRFSTQNLEGNTSV